MNGVVKKKVSRSVLPLLCLSLIVMGAACKDAKGPCEENFSAGSEATACIRGAQQVGPHSASIDAADKECARIYGASKGGASDSSIPGDGSDPQPAPTVPLPQPPQKDIFDAAS